MKNLLYLLITTALIWGCEEDTPEEVDYMSLMQTGYTQVFVSGEKFTVYYGTGTPHDGSTVTIALDEEARWNIFSGDSLYDFSLSVTSNNGKPVGIHIDVDSVNVYNDTDDTEVRFPPG